MKTRILLWTGGLLVLVAAAVSGCAGADRAAVLALEADFQRVGPRYQAYVDADVKLSPEAKDSERKLLQAIADAIAALKRSTE